MGIHVIDNPADYLAPDVEPFLTPDELAEQRRRLTEIERAERRALAITLRTEGKTMTEIASRCGVHVSTTIRDIELGVQTILTEPVEQMVAIQRVVIAKMRASLMHGITYDKDAQKNMIKLLEHEAKLFGLYSPQRISIGTGSEDMAVTAAKLMLELGITPPKHLADKIVVDAEVVGAPSYDERIDPRVAGALAENTDGDEESDPWVMGTYKAERNAEWTDPS